MKKIEWRNENKMLIQTGHKTFDAQTNLLGEGNIYANTMIGTHIRAYTDTECNGLTSPPGHLRSFDLTPWRGTRRIPRQVLDRVKKETENTDIWLYQFFHSKGRKKISHGFVLAAKDHTHIATFVTGPTYKSEWVMMEARKYVCNVVKDDAVTIRQRKQYPRCIYQTAYISCKWEYHCHKCMYRIGRILRN